jgi:hypothetical protein
MPESEENQVTRNDSQAASPPVPAMTEQFQGQLLQLFGDQGNAYKPTEAQVDKMLSLQEKGMDYTHTERTKILPAQWMRVIVTVIGVLGFVGLIWVTAVYAKEHLEKVITGAIGFLAGGASGYGLARSKTSNEEE